MNEFRWTTEGYVKILKDNLKQLSESVASFSPTLPLEHQRTVLRDAARFAEEVRSLALAAWSKAQREDGGVGTEGGSE
jgi:hypothetical protein